MLYLAKMNSQHLNNDNNNKNNTKFI